jgi:hypothetical protein
VVDFVSTEKLNQENTLKNLLLTLTCVLFVSNVFGETYSFRCNYSTGNSGNFDRGYPQTESDKSLGDSIFDNIDLEKKSGRLIGNNGASDVTVLTKGNSLNILEITGTGNMNVTTIFLSNDPKFKGRLPVVQSRHVYLSNGPIPSQYLGFCTKI